MNIERSYNARGWLTEIGDVESPYGFAAGYSYYADGNVKADTSNPAGYAQFVRSYEYDAVDRLASADYGADGLGGDYDLEGLRYDANGNIRGLTRYGQNGSAVDNLSYSYKNNRVTQLVDAVADTSRRGWDAGSGSFEYDAAGRMLQAPDPTGLEAASYNAQGLPEAMVLEGGKTLRYRYSAGGQRTYKQLKGQAATHYIRDGSRTVAVVEGGSLQHWNLTLPGGEVIGRAEASGDRRYYLKDHLGSVRAVVDGGGNVKEVRNYYPFGLPMSGRYDKGSPPTQEDYTGHVKDEATGLHYAGARYYSAAFGRWTSPDPILKGKGAKDLLKDDSRLLTMTSYNYAFDNPTTLTDPTGLAPTDWFIDSSGELQFDQRVKEADDVPTGGKYLGESFTANVGDETLFFGEQGGVFESVPMEGVVVFGNSDRSATEGLATGASGVSAAAAKQSKTLKLAGEVAKGVRTATDVGGGVSTLGAVSLSTFSELGLENDPVGTYEAVKFGADLGLGALSLTGLGGAAASFTIELSGGKQAAVEAIVRQIVKNQTQNALRRELRIGQRP